MIPSDGALKVIRESLIYNQKTGDLIWRERPISHFSEPAIWRMWNTQYAGNIAGCKFPSRKTHYLQLGLSGKMYRAHRICWFLGTGEWPVDQIDHVNGRGLDNRIANLRVVCNKENSKNQSLRIDSTSGVTGVRWDKAKGKWHARIGVNGRDLHLGFFSSKKKAIKARKCAENEHGFHKNHGRVSEG